VIELDNLLSSAKSIELSRNDTLNVQKITRKMKFLVERAEILGIVNTEIIEREALILTYLGKYKQAVVKYKELFFQDDAGFKANFLDIYCNIRSKNLVNDRFGYREITDDKIEDVISDIEKIPLINRGPRRLAVIGSTYKRAAIIVAPDENSKDKRPKIEKMKEYLKKSAQYYLDSAILIGMQERSAIYQVTTFISVSLFCNNSRIKDNIDIRKEIGKSPRTYLKEWIGKVNDENSNRSDIFDQLAQIHLRIPFILLAKNERIKLTEKVITLYERQISRCINLKDLVGEIERIDFHIFMCKNSDGNYSDCIEHYKKIKVFLEQYYRIGKVG
jgi:tetratricopeptide (TPR) repeat protein